MFQGNKQNTPLLLSHCLFPVSRHQPTHPFQKTSNTPAWYLELASLFCSRVLEFGSARGQCQSMRDVSWILLYPISCVNLQLNSYYRPSASCENGVSPRLDSCEDDQAEFLTIRLMKRPNSTTRHVPVVQIWSRHCIDESFTNESFIKLFENLGPWILAPQTVRKQKKRNASFCGLHKRLSTGTTKPTRSRATHPVPCRSPLCRTPSLRQRKGDSAQAPLAEDDSLLDIHVISIL